MFVQSCCTVSGWAWRLKGGGSALLPSYHIFSSGKFAGFHGAGRRPAVQDTGVPMLPSPSSIQRHRLILDVSLMLARQEECENPATDVRYGWADSSPTKGYDMLWIQSHAIAVGTVVATYQASVELTRLLRDIVDLTIERGQALSMEPLESARPLLDCIRQHIRQHIYPPAAVTSGQRG